MAFFSLLPASSPATTKSVFRDTLPDTLPPRRSTSSLACSRVRAPRVPVSTTVLPAKGPREVSSGGRGDTPAASSASMPSRFCGSAKKPAMTFAISGPTSFTRVRASTSAA